MDEIKNSYAGQLLIEFIIVFLLIFLGLSIESFHRDILFLSDKSFNLDVFYFILRETFIVTTIFIISYNFVKGAYYTISRRTSLIIGYYEPSPILTILTDSFLICASLLATVNIRPIIHTTYLESNIKNFNYDFVRYDSLFSILTLLVLAIPLVYLIYKKDNKYKKLKIFGIIIILILVGVVNSFPNFDARIFESTASWTQKNWDDQSKEAEKALSDAQTNEEKAYAYFWLGVAENRKNNYEEAVKYQLKAIELVPDYAAAHASLANAYLGLGKNEPALKHAKDCIKYDPEYAWCYNSMTNYYNSFGDTKNALEYARKATNLDPGNKELNDIYKQILNETN